MPTTFLFFGFLAFRGDSGDFRDFLFCCSQVCCAFSVYCLENVHKNFHCPFGKTFQTKEWTQLGKAVGEREITGKGNLSHGLVFDKQPLTFFFRAILPTPPSFSFFALGRTGSDFFFLPIHLFLSFQFLRDGQHLLPRSRRAAKLSISL